MQTATGRNPGARIQWVIVDSGSTDGTLEFCREIGATVVPFRSDPFNYCAAVNRGAEQAEGDLWIIANNDIEFRSSGDLARLERLFREWPLVALASPGRPSGEAEMEFVLDWINGATWAVRPEAFRSWGGLPEAMSGYGWDEIYTVYQCWRRGWGNAWLTGWDVFHHGSVTFGPLGGNVIPAMRRNLSRLLAALDAKDLDTRAGPDRIVERLTRREQERAPLRLVLSEPWPGWERQGYVNARRAPLEPAARDGAALVVRHGGAADRQWLPWLENELLLQPDTPIVGGDGWYAVRPVSGAYPAAEALIPRARSVSPPPPALMPVLPPKRPTLRQRISAFLHTWRNRGNRLPEGW